MKSNNNCRRVSEEGAMTATTTTRGSANTEEEVEGGSPSTTRSSHNPSNDHTTPVAVATSQQPECLYHPDRVFSPEQLEVFDALVHPVWIFDIDNRCMKWSNSAALVLWNASSLEELRKRSFDDMSEATLNRLKEYQCKFEQGQQISDQWTLYPLGQARQLQVHCSGVRLDPDECSPSMMVEGIPLIKDVEDQVLKETIRGVEMLRHLPMHVCQFDLGGKVTFQNPEAVVIEEHDESDRGSLELDASMNDTDGESSLSSSQRTEEQLTRKRQRSGDFVDRFIDANLGRSLLERLRSGSEPTTDLKAQIHTNQGPRWSAIQLRKTTDPVTGDPAFLYSARDISDAIQAKKDREAKERKSEFLAIMAHEIRTPLHQIIGFTDLLDQTKNLDADQKSYIKLLQQCSQGLLTVISDVLDYSKLEAGKMKIEHIPYEPKAVMEGAMSAVQSSCEEKGIFFTLDWNKDLPFKLCGDPNRLRQILLNLLSNAVKFTSEGGIHVLVECEVTGDRPTTQLSSKKRKTSGKGLQVAKKMIRFIVTDTGMGIPEEHQSMIFRQYHQGALSIAREHGGTGLGLSICKLLVESMGGTLGLESEVSKGSSFWFTLPIEVPKEANVVDPLEDDTMSIGGGLKILVAEDNQINQKLAKRMLERLGHKPDIAENGKVAIEKVQLNSYDLVLMDIQMPVMDGLEATKRLRMMGYTDLQIIGLTASVSRSDFSELGFDDWLPKPVPFKDLKTRLYRVQQTMLQKSNSELDTLHDEVVHGFQ
ncbi:MAG: hypothetical protein SGILL_006622 [Bacillariaceae sp.]